MKKNIRKIGWLVIGLLVCFPQIILAEMISPNWQTGDEWVVKAVYHSPVKKNEWSAPVYWKYAVTNRGTNAAGGFYVVEVSGSDRALQLSARMVYGEDFSLLRAELKNIRRGKEIARTMKYGKGKPARTEQTLIPYDNPVFPLRASSSADFSVTRRISDDLKVKDTIRQEIQTANSVTELPDWPENKVLTQVRCSLVKKDVKPIFVQYWYKNLPWPVFGQNENMKYWLVIEK
ncbi:hypothetical protein QUF80_14750 [Desulfococcaceae bacterium HSG8]|nr:hypothetical protein [Desulfococcaceae bacterium HSG8]